MRASRKRNIVIGALCGILLLMSVGYAAFNSTLNIKGTSSISSNWDISITNVVSKNIVGDASNATEPTWDDLTASMEANLTNPGDSIEYDVTVENRGTINAKLEKVTLSDTKNSAIKFTSSGIKEGEVLNAGSSVVLTIKIEYDKNVTGQPSETTSELNVTLDYVQSDGSGTPPSGPSASDKLTENIVTEGDGLYEDPTEAGRYIYRGVNANNYITFNGEDAGWRIVALETDGTIKIMKVDSVAKMAFESANTRSSEYCNNNSYGCNVWGSSSTMLDIAGNNVTAMPREFNETNTYALPTEESTMAKYLNNDYYSTLTEEAKGQIDNHVWNVGILARNANQTLETDVSQEKSYKWRGKIGLISPTDYIKSSTNEKCPNLNNASTYCARNSYMRYAGEWSTMLPCSCNGSTCSWIMLNSGSLSCNSTPTPAAIRPTVFIKADITLSGSGTLDDPFIIE